MRKVIATLATVGLLVAAAPAQAETVRPGGFIPALSDTRSAGHVEFTGDGLHVFTDDATSNAKAAEYFPVAGSLPAQSKMDWAGTQPQPGVQIVFDFDQTTGNGNDYNTLVGEPVYGVDGNGFYTDWWLTNASSADAKAVAPVNGGGSGTVWHGTLPAWGAAISTAKVYAGGFSLGSGVKGDGTIRSITYGADVYTFSNLAVVTPPTTPPAPTVVAVTGHVVGKVKPSRIKVVVTTDKTPAGSVEGKRLRIKIKVDGRATSKFSLGADDKAKFRRSFKPGTHIVTVLANDVEVGRFTVKG